MMKKTTSSSFTTLIFTTTTLLLLLLHNLHPIKALSTVVFGSQSRELLLLVTKIAAKQGMTASCICAPGTEEGCRRLMYGKEYADAGIDEEGNARPISDPEDMVSALGDADSLVLCGHDDPVEIGMLETLLKYADESKLKKLVLLSKMGISSGGGGGFFGGGGNKAILESEKGLAKIAKEKDLDFSIIRAGNLKGGGPGVDDQGNPVQPWGLNKSYYTTILDIVEYKITAAHDKFSLGADSVSVVPGDPNKMPNMVTLMGTKTSFDPSPTDTNRVVAASACVAALQPEIGSVEVSVGTAAGKEIPTLEEWAKLLQQ